MTPKIEAKLKEGLEKLDESYRNCEQALNNLNQNTAKHKKAIALRKQKEKAGS
ncbi:MAG: hypothetical protein WBG70_17660 [Spirulinaceae cyanobacterium]